MTYTALFQRHELKYLLNRPQQEALLKALEAAMEPDAWPHSSVRSLYFDTPDLVLARRSAEKPTYKEKLRLRSYGPATGDAPVYVELKKKYRGLVYKRRIQMGYEDALSWLSGTTPHPNSDQICREIDYFLEFYRHLGPALQVSYERDALRSRLPNPCDPAVLPTSSTQRHNPSSPSLRITFDREIKARTWDLSLGSQCQGADLLAPHQVLMEVKCAHALPLWLSRLFSKLTILPCSFSKYGRAFLLPEIQAHLAQPLVKAS